MLESLIKFFSNFKKKSNTPRSPFIIVTVVLLVTIPTLFAIFYGYFYEDTSFLSPNEVKIELHDGNGTILFSKEINEANISTSKNAHMLYCLHSDKELSGRTVSADKAPNFRLSVIRSNESFEYDCFFGKELSESLLRDKSGMVYSLPSEQYELFLTSPFCESAYPHATPPSLITGNGEVVHPRNAEWRYRRIDQKLVSAKNIFLSNSYSTYKIGGAIKLSFERVPDECKAKIYDANNSLLYDGSIEDLPLLTVEKGNTLLAHIDATWKEGDSLDFCGNISYDFKVIVGDRSEFAVSATEVYPGQFITLSVTNVDDISKIIFSSKARRDIEFSEENEKAFTELYQIVPTFVRDGEYAKAILPFPIGLPEYTFSFTLSYGASEQRFSINILKPMEGTSIVIPTGITSVSASSIQKEFSLLVKDLPPSSSDFSVWKYEFASPVDYGFTKVYSCEDTLTSDDGKITAKISGNGYVSAQQSGNSVIALNVGRVVKVGNSDVLGNYVVIDHGTGIRIWYCYLSDINAIENSVVAKGDVIGKSGHGTLLPSTGVLILCSVNETLIDPDYIIGRKIDS